MIELKAISKSYTTSHSVNPVLLDVNILLPENSINTIYGNSGTGKTTLLNIIGLITAPNKGLILLDNKKINQNVSLSSYRLKYFGYVFQDHYLMPEFTVYENMQLPQLISNNQKTNIEEKINSLLDSFNLKHIKNKYPINISIGEAQRVAILRSIINHPKIVIADEPTSNLDDTNALNVINLFKNLKENYNYTIIIATHDKRFLDISNNSYKLTDNKLVKL